jgi:hypothetical protein
MPLLNNSVPYAFKLIAEKTGGYLPISFDYIVGGVNNKKSDYIIELGQFPFIIGNN